MDERLDLIEDIIKEIITRNLPQVGVSREKKEEIERSVKEMKKEAMCR